MGTRVCSDMWKQLKLVNFKSKSKHEDLSYDKSQNETLITTFESQWRQHSTSHRIIKTLYIAITRSIQLMESPEKEVLRSPPRLENSPPPFPPCTKPSSKGIPLPPAPLVFTPDSRPSCLNCDAEMTLGHQCEVIESDSSWEDVENEQDLYPTFDVNSETWAEELTNSIRRFHGETIEPMLDNSESNTW